MVDKNNLNRVKGILSAKQGTEIPKYNIGAKFTKQKGSGLIYSNDGATWFTDPNLTFRYMGSLDGFMDVSTVDIQIPGAVNLTPTTAVENSANKMEQQLKESVTPTIKSMPKEKFEALPELGESIKDVQSNVTKSLNTVAPLNITSDEVSAGMNFVKNKTDRQNKETQTLHTASNITAQAFNTIGNVAAGKQIMIDSATTKAADALYTGVSDIANKFGPVGKAVSSIMGIAKGAGDIIQELGGGTDQQTKTDKWMDSAFFSWNIGMLNGFAGKNTQEFGVDQDTLAQVGSSYGGTSADIADAAKKAGKKYGLFSTKDRKKADAAINKARNQQTLMADIADTANDQRLAVQSMGEQAGLAYSMMTSGGYDQKFTYAAKHGGMLEWNPVTILEWEPQVELNWELPTFKEGGNIELVEELEWVPEFKSGNEINLDEVRNYYKDYDLSNIEFITDDSPRTEGNKLYIRNDEDAVHELWHYLSQNRPSEIYKEYYDNLDDNRIIELGGDLQFVKRMENDPGHFYHPSELEARIKAAKFKTKGQSYTKEFFQNLRNEENKYGNNMRDLLHMYNDDNLVKIFSLKKGGSIGDSDIPEIEETTQKNVIPEGALHKNKHHMEHAEGLTKKGIPVIDDDGDQQAEIEHSEIIFTLEVTKKLEEYYKIFYSDDSTKKEKEQAALDAGKLLVYQILENTEDRTGLIESCKKGGTITLKKTTDDLIEEALEWVPTVVVVEEEVVEKSPKKPEKLSEKEQMKKVLKEILIELLTD